MFRMPVTGFLLDCCFRRRPVRPAIRHQPQWRSGACSRPAAALDFRNLNAQRAVLVVGVDVVLLHLIADVEAARAGADVTFTTKPLAGLILVAAVLVLMGGHGQIAVVQRDADVVLLEAGHVDVHVIALVVLAHVRTHHVRRGHRRAVVGGTQPSKNGSSNRSENIVSFIKAGNIAIIGTPRISEWNGLVAAPAG